MPPIVITPRRFADERGWFSETYSARSLAQHGIIAEFCQDNQSFSSAAGTVRGLHFQSPPFAQAKLVRCVSGRIFDVAVDIRRESPTFGQWVGAVLSAEDGKQLYLPTGYAHGFMTLEPNCVIAYKVDNFYAAEAEGGILWNDPKIGIDWPKLEISPRLSGKDEKLGSLSELTVKFPYDGHPLQSLTEIKL